ncbi:glutathione synthase [Myxococcaceae bacterium]|jgi:glutathione synthase|nr:glutathione synthase [Myxococcaceae bacterium]
MADRRRTLLVVMDPLPGIDVTKDTTFVLMLEAARRGHRVLVCELGDLHVDRGRAAVRARDVRLAPVQGRHAELGAVHSFVIDEVCDGVLQRKDPPVDEAYVTATQILMLCRRALVLNRPEGILAANEKLHALRFAELMAETCVTRSIPDLVDFMTQLGGEMIVKPLGGKGGEGIFHVRHDDRNLFSILEQATAFGSRWTMAQRYLPDVRKGDKRILLVDGEPIGAVLRVPAERETRANLHVGGRAERTTLDAADLRIVDRIGPSLRADGFFFVGIDVIGGFLTEINVTSPTGVQEVNALESIRLEERILDALERHLDARPPG